MHTVVLLAHALDLAGRLRFVVRQEWLDGDGGGGCELHGRKMLFMLSWLCTMSVSSGGQC